MTRGDEIRQLHVYNRWATERVLESVRLLTGEQFRQDMGSSFRSIRDTLVHVMSAEWVWLSRLQGHSPAQMPEEWKAMELEEITRQWEQIDASLQELLAALTETGLDEALTYRNMAGQDWVSTRGQILRHVVNHSSYHRGQITTMLRQLGAAAPTTDLIAYYRTEVRTGLMSAG
jgi:uncharacterized damage-inducible protein DinB